MIVLYLITLNKLRGLLCNLSRNTEVNREWLRRLCERGLGRRTAALSFRTRGAVRVLRICVTSCALKKLQEVLLYRPIPTWQSLLHICSCTPKQTGQMLTQLLSDLPVETAVEEGVGCETEVANPGDNLL